MRAEQRKAAHAMEDEPGNFELVSCFSRPVEALVGDDAARRWLLLLEVVLERLLEPVHGGVEFSDEVWRGDGVEIFAGPLGGRNHGGKWELEELDGEAGAAGSDNGGAEAGGIVRGGDEGDGGAVLGEEPSHVDHGDHVALSQQWNQDEVGLAPAWA